MANLAIAASQRCKALIGVAAAAPFATATYGLAVLGTVTGLLLAPSHPVALLFVATILCGWSELDGACGTSHAVAITPLRGLDPTHRLWLKAAATYTIAGVVTAASVGAVLGIVGMIVRALIGHDEYLLAAVAALAIVLSAREMGLVSFGLPQFPRQTQKMWAIHFGFVTGAAMWGAHIGLGVATVIKHGGLYVVAASALLLGPLAGAALMAAFWLGRTLPIWAAPALSSDHANGGTLLDSVITPWKAYRHCSAIGLLAMAAALMVIGG